MNDDRNVEVVAEALFNHEQKHLFTPELSNKILYGTHPVTWEFINNEKFADYFFDLYKGKAKTAIDAYDSEMKKHIKKLYKALLFLYENSEPPPESQCNCFTRPPCSDCVNFGGLREAFDTAKIALASIPEELRDL
jgi:hypothetical protein